MYIKQISAYLENTTGRLTAFTKILSDNNISMKALCIADTADFGILRCIVDEPEEAVKTLNAHGFNASITEVIAAEMESAAGGLHKILSILSDNDIVVNYVYSAVGSSGEDHSAIIIKVSDPTAAIDVLSKEGIKMFCTKDLD